MNQPRPEPGSPIVVQWRKWDGSTHWRHEGYYLGQDRWGDWVGQRTGQPSRRPGAGFSAEQDGVTLFPHQGPYVHSWNAEPAATAIYIDLAWDLQWTPQGPTAIDMDLDVVRGRDGRQTFLDDQDEWAEHQVQYGYPREFIEQVQTEAERLLGEVAAGRAPFDAVTGEHWLAELARLVPSSN